MNMHSRLAFIFVPFVGPVVGLFCPISYLRELLNVGFSGRSADRYHDGARQLDLADLDEYSEEFDLPKVSSDELELSSL